MLLILSVLFEAILPLLLEGRLITLHGVRSESLRIGRQSHSKRGTHAA